MGHYSEHLGRQALSFLKHLMIDQGRTRHERCRNIFEDNFYTRMKCYPSLNSYMLSYYEEEKRKLKNEP